MERGKATAARADYQFRARLRVVTSYGNVIRERPRKKVQ